MMQVNGTIAIGCDHVGFSLKQIVIAHLKEKGYTVMDYGTDKEERCNYPAFGRLVAHAVAYGKAEKGIVICGTGVGISISANKVHGVRAVVCSEPYSALLSRQHNDTNVLAFGARVVGSDLALMIVDNWLSGTFEGGRHKARVDMIAQIERENQPTEL